MPDYDPLVPYTGDLYVQKRTEIEYGIVQAVPVETVLEFIDAHRSDIAARGYRIAFAQPPKTSP
jgi:hypothetical protein